MPLTAPPPSSPLAARPAIRMSAPASSDGSSIALSPIAISPATSTTDVPAGDDHHDDNDNDNDNDGDVPTPMAAPASPRDRAPPFNTASTMNPRDRGGTSTASTTTFPRTFAFFTTERMSMGSPKSLATARSRPTTSGASLDNSVYMTPTHSTAQLGHAKRTGDATPLEQTAAAQAQSPVSTRGSTQWCSFDGTDDLKIARRADAHANSLRGAGPREDRFASGGGSAAACNARPCVEAGPVPVHDNDEDDEDTDADASSTDGVAHIDDVARDSRTASVRTPVTSAPLSPAHPKGGDGVDSHSKLLPRVPSPEAHRSKISSPTRWFVDRLPKADSTWRLVLHRKRNRVSAWTLRFEKRTLEAKFRDYVNRVFLLVIAVQKLYLTYRSSETLTHVNRTCPSFNLMCPQLALTGFFPPAILLASVLAALILLSLNRLRSYDRLVAVLLVTIYSFVVIIDVGRVLYFFRCVHQSTGFTSFGQYGDVTTACDFCPRAVSCTNPAFVERLPNIAGDVQIMVQHFASSLGIAFFMLVSGSNLPFVQGEVIGLVFLVIFLATKFLFDDDSSETWFLFTAALDSFLKGSWSTYQREVISRLSFLLNVRIQRSAFSRHKRSWTRRKALVPSMGRRTLPINVLGMAITEARVRGLPDLRVSVTDSVQNTVRRLSSIVPWARTTSAATSREGWSSATSTDGAGDLSRLLAPPPGTGRWSVFLQLNTQRHETTTTFSWSTASAVLHPPPRMLHVHSELALPSARADPSFDLDVPKPPSRARSDEWARPLQQVLRPARSVRESTALAAAAKSTAVTLSRTPSMERSVGNLAVPIVQASSLAEVPGVVLEPQEWAPGLPPIPSAPVSDETKSNVSAPSVTSPISWHVNEGRKPPPDADVPPRVFPTLHASSPSMTMERPTRDGFLDPLMATLRSVKNGGVMSVKQSSVSVDVSSVLLSNVDIGMLLTLPRAKSLASDSSQNSALAPPPISMALMTAPQSLHPTMSPDAQSETSVDHDVRTNLSLHPRLAAPGFDSTGPRPWPHQGGLLGASGPFPTNPSTVKSRAGDSSSPASSTAVAHSFVTRPITSQSGHLKPSTTPSSARALSPSPTRSRPEATAPRPGKHVRSWPMRFRRAWRRVQHFFVYTFPSPEQEAVYRSYYHRKLRDRFIITNLTVTVAWCLVAGIGLLTKAGTAMGSDPYGISSFWYRQLPGFVAVVLPVVALHGFHLEGATLEVFATIYVSTVITVAIAMDAAARYLTNNPLVQMFLFMSYLSAIMSATTLRLRPRIHLSVIAMATVIDALRWAILAALGRAGTAIAVVGVSCAAMVLSITLTLFNESAQRRYFYLRRLVELDAPVRGGGGGGGHSGRGKDEAGRAPVAAKTPD
ncbi:hypothetical protein GGF31_002905 [Allomyces arbusculus]|nr:hypothetical protein GGF31_002905 [Allomyces arbusculus]